MNIEEIDKTIIPFLTSKGNYSQLISLFKSQKTQGHAFELYFAYAMEHSGVKLEYEKRANGDKTVDFCYSQNENKIWFELVSPDMNQVLKDNIEQQLKDTESDGLSYYQIILTNDQKNPNYNSDAQLIKLQEKILEKPKKFLSPSEKIFNVLVVDCSTAFRGFDDDDFRNITYGYAKNPAYQAWFNGKRIKGLLETGFKKNGSDELQTKLSALLCFEKVNLDLFNPKHAFISCNPLPGEDQYNKAFNCLREIQSLNTSRYINPIRPSTSTTNDINQNNQNDNS